jgi:hypothetical protein
LKALEYGQIS